MKKRNVSKQTRNSKPAMLEHYDLDYRKAKPNRFAGRVKPEDLVVVVVEPDVAQVFPTTEAVNSALRTLIRMMRSTKVATK